MHMNMTMGGGGWQVMQDAVAFVELNHQGGPRGGTEFAAPNWWMGMATRHTSRGELTFTSMLSLDPVTVGRHGYRELFQTGETLDGAPLVDRQHPHDVLMQAAVVWRMPVTTSTSFTVAAAAAGDPALGPIAFMHRDSAADNPSAPLGHHVFDSTHVSFGVVSAAVDRGRWTLEGSVFNGREPDDQRWDVDFGRLDSVSTRLWFRPTPSWAIQVSTGHLTAPEALEPGNLERTTASVSWNRTTHRGIQALTMGYGRNDTEHSSRQAVFVEAAQGFHKNRVYQRLEALEVETGVLQTGGSEHAEDVVTALTIGGVRGLGRMFGVSAGLGADLTIARTPAALEASYSKSPVSFHIFLELGLSAGTIGPRMRNARLTRPMGDGGSGH